MDDTTNRALHALDLAPGASLDDVKKSYRELALIWHPDKVPDRVKDRATAKFTEINEAYQWLVRNPENLRTSSAAGSSTGSFYQRQTPPRYRSFRSIFPYTRGVFPDRCLTVRCVRPNRRLRVRRLRVRCVLDRRLQPHGSRIVDRSGCSTCPTGRSRYPDRYQGRPVHLPRYRHRPGCELHRCSAA